MIYAIEKKYVSSVLGRKDISNSGVLNMHRLNTMNSGDLMCAPYLYFDELKKLEKIDVIGYLSNNFLDTISWTKKIAQNNIILGGGGFLDRESFSHSISILNALQKKGKKIVPWGIGHNNPSFKETALFYQQIKDFKLIGLRDYQVKNTEWVPCVSCMNEIFDRSFEQKYEIGIIEHEHISLSDHLKNDVPCIKNNSSFEEIIEFIGSVSTLITNSYHAMYWAMLMNRKVIVIPNSSKMFSFKYKVPICYDVKDYKDHFKNANIYSGLLEECRTINMNFAEKVFNYLSL